MTRSLQKPQAGFTLVETMIVLAVIAVMLTLAVPMARDWLMNSRIRSAAESLHTGLQLARMEAVRRNANVEFVLDAPPSSKWTVRVQGGADIEKDEGTAGSGSVTVTPSDVATIAFNGLGRPLPLPADWVSFDVDLPPAVMAPSVTRDLRLRVSGGGQIVLCDPNINIVGDVRTCP